MKTNTKQAEPPASAGGANAGEDQTAGNGTDSEERMVGSSDAGGSDLSVRVDIDQLRAENEQLKATIRLDAAHRQITGELAKSGARSPELLFEAIRADLQFADDGAVANGAALVETLKARYPEQFGSRAGSIDGGAGAGQPARLTKAALARMTTAEIAALDWADVRRALSS